MDGNMCLGTVRTGMTLPARLEGVAPSPPPRWLRGRGDGIGRGPDLATLGVCIGHGRQSKGVVGKISGRNSSLDKYALRTRGGKESVCPRSVILLPGGTLATSRRPPTGKKEVCDGGGGGGEGVAFASTHVDVGPVGGVGELEEERRSLLGLGALAGEEERNLRLVKRVLPAPPASRERGPRRLKHLGPARLELVADRLTPTVEFSSE